MKLSLLKTLVTASESGDLGAAAWQALAVADPAAMHQDASVTAVRGTMWDLNWARWLKLDSAARFSQR